MFARAGYAQARWPTNMTSRQIQSSWLAVLLQNHFPCLIRADRLKDPPRWTILVNFGGYFGALVCLARKFLSELVAHIALEYSLGQPAVELAYLDRAES